MSTVWIVVLIITHTAALVIGCWWGAVGAMNKIADASLEASEARDKETTSCI